MGEPLSSILALTGLAYFNPISKIGENRTQSLINKFEVVFSKI